MCKWKRLFYLVDWTSGNGVFLKSILYCFFGGKIRIFLTRCLLLWLCCLVIWYNSSKKIAIAFRRRNWFLDEVEVRWKGKKLTGDVTVLFQYEFISSISPWYVKIFGNEVEYVLRKSRFLIVSVYLYDKSRWSSVTRIFARKEIKFSVLLEFVVVYV